MRPTPPARPRFPRCPSGSASRSRRWAADPAWRAMLETAARLHVHSLNNQLLIMLGAAAGIHRDPGRRVHLLEDVERTAAGSPNCSPPRAGGGSSRYEAGEWLL